MSKFYTTKNISETLELEILIKIHELIIRMEGEVDYLQVFDIEDKNLTHSQEVPRYKKEHELGRKYNDCKIFAIRTDEINNSYWTVMYAEEY